MNMAKKFRTKRKEIRDIEIEDEDGNVHLYLLRELNGSGRDEYFNKMSGKVNIDMETGKPTGVRDFTNMNADLLGKCLFTQDKNEPVPISVIQDWPGETLDELFKMALDLSGLKAATTDQERDEQDARIKNELGVSG
jgi:hypothetical protein